MEFNKIQTSITSEEFVKSLDKELYAELIDFVTSIQFLQNLTSPNRKYACDLERDHEGKIIVNITNPHILEDMDYFRQPAIHHQKHGQYTHLHPNANPNSEYARFWKEEARRCREGYIRKSDGEWIPGPFYFYLNYAPILKDKFRKEKGSRVDRVQDFANFYDGDYLFYHYTDQARNNGKHCNVLKRRGAGYSYKAGAGLTRIFVLGDSEVATENQKAFAIANEKEFLIKDGVLNKFEDHINWCADHTPWPRIRLKDSLNDMHWILGYQEKGTGQNRGVLNEVMGITTKDDPDKARGKRGAYIYWEEIGKDPHILKKWQIARPSVETDNYAHGTMVGYGCLTAKNKVWDVSGKLWDIEDFVRNRKGTIIGYEEGKGISFEHVVNINPIGGIKSCVKLTTNTGRNIECSIDHPILWGRRDYGSCPRIGGKRPFIKKTKFVKAEDIKIGDQIGVLDIVDVWGIGEKLWHPYILGILLGDGSYGFNKTPVISTAEEEVFEYIRKYFDYFVEKQRVTKENKIYREIRVKGITKFLRDLKMYGQTKKDKRLPNNIHACRRGDVCTFIAGVFDADGYYGKDRIVLSSISKDLLLEMQLLLQKFGIHCNINSVKPHDSSTYKSRNVYFHLDIRRKESIDRFYKNIKPKVAYKKEALIKLYNTYKSRKEEKSKSIKGIHFERVVKVEYVGEKEIFNLTSEFNHTYIANGIITHNTGGAEKADFRGEEEMFYNPRGYNIYAIPNVFDRNVAGSADCAFFSPAYLNRLGCYDHNGNSDVVKALIEILEKRLEIKYGASDPNTLVQNKAEVPVTPQEAVLRKEGSLFPVLDLKDYLAEVMPNLSKFIQPHYIGRLRIGLNGAIEWGPEPTGTVIRDFPLSKDVINRVGCIEIFEQPIKDNTGSIPWGRYIAGIDPIDYDAIIGSGSLGSIFVFDLWTDRIVAEYTGRPPIAADFYDQCLRMLKYYNAEANYENNLKGLFAFFDQYNSLHYLCDTPQNLRDMEYVRGGLFGNRAHPYSEKVYTPKGIKRWGEIKKGDYLFDSFGGKTKIIDIPFDEKTDIYEITLRDGRKIKASKNHLWVVIDNFAKKNKIITTGNMLENYYYLRGKYKESRYYIPNQNVAVPYKNKKIPVNPYFLGIMLGDGCFTGSTKNNAYFTAAYHDMKFYMEYLRYDYTTLDDRHYRIRYKNINNIFKNLNLENIKSRGKFIPDLYKYNSERIRLEVLRGLMDTDGTVDESRSPSFTSVSGQLARDVLEIARSLGINGNLNISKNDYGKIYTVNLYTDKKIFNLYRKSKLQRLTKNRAFKTAIVDIKKIGIEKAKCVTVDSVDNCYLIGEYIITHNSKGTPANKAINSWARKLQADWMISPAKSLFIGEEEEEEVIKLNLQKIRSIAYVKECIAWEPDGNYDRVSAMGMLMILREDRLKYQRIKVEDRKRAIYEDAFFQRGGFGKKKKKYAIQEKNIYD